VDFRGEYGIGLRDLLRALVAPEASWESSVPVQDETTTAVVAVHEVAPPRTEPLISSVARGAFEKRGRFKRIWVGKWRIKVAVTATLALIGVSVGLHLRSSNQPIQVPALPNNDPTHSPVRPPATALVDTPGSEVPTNAKDGLTHDVFERLRKGIVRVEVRKGSNRPKERGMGSIVAVTGKTLSVLTTRKIFLPKGGSHHSRQNRGSRCPSTDKTLRGWRDCLGPARIVTAWPC
jgi:hypothetical protein